MLTLVDLVRYTGDTLTPANSVFIDMNLSEKLTKMGEGGRVLLSKISGSDCVC